MFDYAKLEGKIKEIYGAQYKFANALGLSATTVSDKLNNKVQWTQKEINTTCTLLFINPADIAIYFFTPKS